MVYLKHWGEFNAQAIDLYKRNPDRTRYLIKAHPARQWLVLKVTDDQTVLKYRSRSTVILNRFESFNRQITALMAGKESVTVTDVAKGVTETAASALAAGADKVAGAEGAAAGAAGVGGGGGGTSSNKKKKKKGGKK
ncbi:unnamed protein product [Jaminaea pallidilutea]